MSDFRAMGSALYARMGTVSYTYNSSGTVPTTRTLGTFDSLATQGGTVTPYVIFALQDSLDDYAFGNKRGESADYLLKVVSDRATPSAQAYTIYEQAHDALQDAALSITGSTVLRVRRRSRVAYIDNEKYWHVGGIYRLDTVDS